MSLKKQAIGFVSAASLALLAGSAVGQDGKSGAPGLIFSDGETVAAGEAIFGGAGTGGPAPECLSFAGLASWDAQDDEDNVVINLDIGAGNALTGVGWDIGLSTVGDSWLSEAVILHSNSTGSADPNGIFLTLGVGLDQPGDQDFSSGGQIIDFGDNMLPDVVAGPDGILQLQLFETFDDVADAIDANYRNAAAPQLCSGLALVCSDQEACNSAVSFAEARTVPANNAWALALLVALLASLGVVAVRRFG